MIQTSRSTLRFRGRSYLAMVLVPQIPLRTWLADVDAWLARSPGFFAGKSLVVDVTGLPLTQDDFVALLADLKERKISVLAVEGADPAWLTDGLPPLLTGGRNVGAEATAESSRQTATASEPPRSLVLQIDAPIRSGQSIVHPDGDVIVVGSIASGAEVTSAGSIHVYGALRGRAFAGMYGDKRARIFCRRLEAELIAVNGYYRIADELDPRFHKKPVQAWLDGENLRVATLD